MLNYSAISIFWWNCPLSIPFLQNLLLEDKSEWLFLFATTAVPILVWQCIGLVQDIFLAAPPIKNAVYKNISCDYSTYSDEREGERWWGWGSNKLVRGEAHWERDGIFLGSFSFFVLYWANQLFPSIFQPFIVLHLSRQDVLVCTNWQSNLFRFSLQPSPVSRQSLRIK